MKNNILLNKQTFFIFFLFIFSILINQYYGNKGLFPVDSFSHFDTGFRILLGEYPFKDYWIVSGPFVDYVQSIFFYFFGTNWQSYIFHASILNAILTLSTFFILRTFDLNIYYSFIYSLSFSVLAYPTSGTPFVDHHSAFLSLLGIYNLILGIKTEKKKYWILLPIFLIFAFLSKQVPSSYIILSIIIILSYYLIIQKKNYWLKYSCISFLFTIFLIFILGKYQGISLSSFINQYIYYPQSIGAERISNFTFSFRGVLGNFKFIYIAFLPLLFINIKNIFYINKYYKKKDFYYFLILTLFTGALIFHQILTRNQIFIFFLIPILFAFSQIYIKLYKFNIKKFLNLTLVIVCLFAVTKYHIRFNENRKFHELNYVNFNLALEANVIDSKFFGLKWITPEHGNEVQDEINSLKEIKAYLKNDDRNIMLMTNYSFFSTLLEKNFFSTTRWHIFDGTDYPQKNNKYFTNYKNLFTNSLKKNNVEVIYKISPVKKSNIYDYISEDCFSEKKINDILMIFELIECKEIR